MDILIKNKEMPKACYKNTWSGYGNCPLHFFNSCGLHYCSISESIRCSSTKRPKDCPLVEVEEVESGKLYPMNRKIYVEVASTEERKKWIY